MSRFPLKPFHSPLDLERQIEQVFSELIHRPWGRESFATAWQPDIDLYETEDAYLIEADLPGVSPENLHLNLEPHWVTISGTRGSTTLVTSIRHVSLERHHGHFSRRVYLEHAVDPAQLQQQYADGIYHIRLPKA